MHFLKNTFRVLIALSLLIPAAMPAVAQTTPTVSPLFETNRTAPDRLIIRLKKNSDRAGVETAMKRLGGKTRKQIGRRPTFVISVPAAQRDKLKQQLSKDKRIDSVELDRAWRPAFTANDPLISQKWHLTALGASIAWNTTRGAGLTIAILDTGIDATHPEFANKIVPGWNTFSDNADVIDSIGHGTWVAGTAAATVNNGVGGAGLAGEAMILPIKVTDLDGYGYSSTIADGLAVAEARGAKIANISFEINGGDPVIADAAQQFFANGGLVFAAAGNTGLQQPDANNPYIVSVGSTAQDRTVSTFSSHGPYIDLVAPGENIITTSPGNQYARVTGTSFASPLAAAEAALIWATNPALNNFDVVSIMRQSAHDIDAQGIDMKSGAGLIDAGAAVALAKPTVFAPAPTPTPAPIPETPTSTLVVVVPPPISTPTSTPQLPEQPKLQKPIQPFATSTPQIPHLKPREDEHTDALGRIHEPNLGKSVQAHERNEERKAAKKKLNFNIK